jgi:hypothetical protein
MARYAYGFDTDHPEARYAAEMIVLAPATVRNLFQLNVYGSPIMVGKTYAQFHWFGEDVKSPVNNEEAVAKVRDALANEVAAFAAKRTVSHVPKWTFMYNRNCQEDLDVVAAIRASPPPVAMDFAVDTNLPPGERCVLFPQGGYSKEARERVLSELKAAKKRCFPSRPPSAAQYVLAVNTGALKVREAVARLQADGRDIQVQVLLTSIVTTLWVNNCTEEVVYYGDKPVLDRLEKYLWAKKVAAAAAPPSPPRTALPAPLSTPPVEFFLAAREAAMTLPNGYADDSVRYQMYVKNKDCAAYLAQMDTLPAAWRRRISTVFVNDDAELENTCVDLWPLGTADSVRYQMSVCKNERAAFLEQLDALPAVWRRRISVVFVDDSTEIAQTCVELWPQSVGFPKSSRYQDVMAMLAWKE